MSRIDLKIPNIGEFKDVEVIELLISEGQSIKKNDPLITIESDKSSVEIPSIEEGEIVKINLKVGDKVSEGDKILELEKVETKKIKENQRIKKKSTDEKIVKEINIVEDELNYKEEQVFKIRESSKTLASPKARKFARELGADINQIPGSERQGRVTEADIKNFILTKKNTPDIKEKKLKKEIVQEYLHSEFGEIEVKDIPRVKKLSATYLMNSWTNIPHVTNHDEADITELEEKNNSISFYSKSINNIIKKISKF